MISLFTKRVILFAVLLLEILLCSSGFSTVQDTLVLDNNVPTYFFKYPDAFGDNYRNMRFEAPVPCTVTGVMFAFPTRGMSQLTSGDPTLIVMLWATGADSFPDLQRVLISDTIAFAEFSGSIFSLDSVWRGTAANFVSIDLSNHGLTLDSAENFHVGYSALCDPGDSLAILADGSTTSELASEYFNGHFVSMREEWGVGTNFFIRLIIETESAGTQILEPANMAENYSVSPAFPNPFNPTTTIDFNLVKNEATTLVIYDILGRETAQYQYGFLAPGKHRIQIDGSTWSSGKYFAKFEFGHTQRIVQLILEK